MKRHVSVRASVGTVRTKFKACIHMGHVGPGASMTNAKMISTHWPVGNLNEIFRYVIFKQILVIDG